MARAKYKIGTLVKATRQDGGGSVFGEVEAITTRKDGYKYDVRQGDVFHVLDEKEIEKAYRVVTERKARESAAVVEGEEKQNG